MREKNYLKWIRGLVGPQKLLMVYAAACVYDEHGRLLWQKRGDFGWWGLPGGVLELDENLAEAVVREVAEETGLAVRPTRLVGLYSTPDFDVTYRNGDEVQQVAACFACAVVSGRLTVDAAETVDLAWLPAGELPATAPWYAAMAADFWQARPAAAFAHGTPGASRTTEPYFKRVRRHIGAAPFIAPTGLGFVQDDAGRVLLMRRTDMEQAVWSLPGGMMELGERIDQAAVNEVREETGLIVTPTRLVGVYSGNEYWLRYPHGDEVKVVSALFACRVSGGRLAADGVEASAARFFAPDALPPIAPRHQQRVADGLANRVEAFFR